LQNNAGDSLQISAGSASFTFSTPLLSGASYNVTVQTQPITPTQICTVEPGTGQGVVGDGNVTGVRITCQRTEFTVGGQVAGLAGSGLLLQNNGGPALAIAADGAFTFPGSLTNGAAYSVSVAAQPVNLSQTCAVSQGSGSINGADVASVQVACTTNAFTIGGNVAGLGGLGLRLRLNGAESIDVVQNGPFTFVTPVPSGVAYDVTVERLPFLPPGNCTVTNGAGTVGAADVADVTVNCL
ncbi:MAG: hypothetical protein ACREV5_18975, partial [Steroidobacter sp.]